MKDLNFIKVYMRGAEELPILCTKCASAFPGHVDIGYLKRRHPPVESLGRG
jgi:hypothetical protein